MSEKKVIIESSVTKYFCDICNTEMQQASKCYICGKDLCVKCVTFDNRDWGDYPTRYCDNCWLIGETYREEMLKIENDADEKIAELRKKWKQQALKEKSNGTD